MQAGLAAFAMTPPCCKIRRLHWEYCKEQERSQRYIDASGDFFRYVEKLVHGVKLQLRDDVERASHFSPAIASSRIATLRRNILTFKDYLRLLHTLIKPAADAHTLSIPAPLVNLARDHLHQIEGMKTAGVVVLLTPQLMYFQRPHSHVKWQAARAENLIRKPRNSQSLVSLSCDILRGQASSIILPSITRLDISFTRSYQPYHLRTLRLPTSNRLPIKR